MRILMLSQWFDPEPAIKGLPFARALVAAGHEVRVITGFPNYPGGKVYPGYRIRPYRHETIDGIQIIRVALYPSHDGSAIRRVLNYGSFALTSTIAGLTSAFEPDVMYVYHPPLTVGLAAAVIGGLRRIPFIYDVQDLWPDTLAATGMIGSPRLLSIVGSLAKWVYRRADVVVAQSPGFVTRLIDRGVPPEKVRLIHNWCDEASLASRSASRVDLTPLAGRFNVVFAGNMGKAQALDAVLDAAAIVASRDARVQFVLLGGGTEAANLESRARTMSLTNVAFLPRLEMNQVGHVLDAADALLVHLRDSPLFSITLPSKTQAYLFAAKPIIMAVPGDAANLVARAGAGVCAQPEDPQSIADAVLHLAELPNGERVEMGARGRRFYDDALSLRTGTAHMLEAFEHAIAGGARRSRRVHP